MSGKGVLPSFILSAVSSVDELEAATPIGGPVEGTAERLHRRANNVSGDGERGDRPDGGGGVTCLRNSQSTTYSLNFESQYLNLRTNHLCALQNSVQSFLLQNLAIIILSIAYLH